MRSIEPETIKPTTKELLDDAIDGLGSKLAKLQIAVFQEKTNDLGFDIAVQATVIRDAIKNLKGIRGKL